MAKSPAKPFFLWAHACVNDKTKRQYRKKFITLLAETEQMKQMAGEKKNFRSYEIGGAICAVIGFLLVVIGSSVFLKLITTLSSTTADYSLLGGLVILVVGFGLLGYGWAEGWSTPTDDKTGPLKPSPRMSIVLTLIATTVIAVMAVWADSTGNLLWTAVTIGAIGGLVHEIAQSKGTAFFPDTDNSQQKKNGESYLGGLLGILLGGAAGLVALSVSNAPTSVSTQMIATAFAAGVALKGIADSAASQPNTGSPANTGS
jgi:protein-S-isoprenylcysteine O-methyltransferase Ste14